MARRFPVSEVIPGRVRLSEAESHHARAVMRLAEGDGVEVFDAAGRSAAAVIVALQPLVEVEVREVQQPAAGRLRLTIASAVPKGQRADWLVEKLAEIGVDEFVPLQTARSVVHPEGKGKTERWERLASEAAKQSRRKGTLHISALTPLAKVEAERLWHLSTAAGGLPLAGALGQDRPAALTVLIGPEGGWTPEEEASLQARGSTAVSLTESILRIETAGLVAAGAILSCWRG